MDVQCYRCGEFRLSDVAERILSDRLSSQGRQGIALVSGWLREHEGAIVASNDLDEILLRRMPTIGERAERLLLHLAKCFPKAGTDFQISSEPIKTFVKSINLDGGSFETQSEELQSSATVLLGIGYCEDQHELSFLVEDYLCSEQEFLSQRVLLKALKYYRITPAGWARVHELRQGHGTGAVGFIAMWFAEQVKPAAKIIHRAISAAGYDPVRIDRVEHNNRIDDEIIARIRGSRFLVADVTGSRGGVYFEAGFALGLGLPVIWLCREDDLANVHFDNRQYNFILWKPDELDELERRLQNRIEATLGRGPLAPPEPRRAA